MPKNSDAGYVRWFEAAQFAQRFDGFSIGSNDLTQLVPGVDRDSAELAYLFDERNEAVKTFIRGLIADAHRAGATVGICGQAPSQYLECGPSGRVRHRFHVLSPDSVLSVKKRVAALEGARARQAR
jgi:pyruvate,water dikinase